VVSRMDLEVGRGARSGIQRSSFKSGIQKPSGKMASRARHKGTSNRHPLKRNASKKSLSDGEEDSNLNAALFPIDLSSASAVNLIGFTSQLSTDL